MNQKFFLFAAFAATVFMGCRKADSSPTDTEPPVIRLQSPADNANFSPTQQVVLTGTVTDNVKIAVLRVEIVNQTSGAFVAHDHFTPGGTSFSLARNYMLPGGATYRFTIDAEDGQGNDAQTRLTVKVN